MYICKLYIIDNRNYGKKIINYVNNETYVSQNNVNNYIWIIGNK